MTLDNRPFINAFLMGWLIRFGTSSVDGYTAVGAFAGSLNMIDLCVSYRYLDRMVGDTFCYALSPSGLALLNED